LWLGRRFLRLGGEIFGKRVVGALFVPKDADDPPALAVVEKLKTVDAAREGSFAGGVARFVTAENLGDVAEGLNAIHDGVLEETVLEEVAAGPSGVFIGAHGAKVDGTIGAFCSGGEAGCGQEEGTEAAPVAFAGRAGDDVVDRHHDAVDGLHVFGLWSGDAGEWVGGSLCGSGTLRGGLLGGRLRGGKVRNGESCDESEGGKFHFGSSFVI
jgi:hypothetical protein